MTALLSGGSAAHRDRCDYRGVVTEIAVVRGDSFPALSIAEIR